jgi:hypothetical protein
LQNQGANQGIVQKQANFNNVRPLQPAVPTVGTLRVQLPNPSQAYLNQPPQVLDNGTLLYYLSGPWNDMKNLASLNRNVDNRLVTTNNPPNRQNFPITPSGIDYFNYNINPQQQQFTSEQQRYNPLQQQFNSLQQLNQQQLGPLQLQGNPQKQQQFDSPQLQTNFQQQQVDSLQRQGNPQKQQQFSSPPLQTNFQQQQQFSYPQLQGNIQQQQQLYPMEVEEQGYTTGQDQTRQQVETSSPNSNDGKNPSWNPKHPGGWGWSSWDSWGPQVTTQSSIGGSSVAPGRGFLNRNQVQNSSTTTEGQSTTTNTEGTTTTRPTSTERVVPQTDSIDKLRRLVARIRDITRQELSAQRRSSISRNRSSSSRSTTTTTASTTTVSA